MHYLDHAATTPMPPEVRDAVLPYLGDTFGNPSSVHAFGRDARKAVEDAREKVAAAVGASPSDIVFTGGGTEADNLALKGAAAKLRAHGNHVVTTAFEHHAVLEAVEWLGHNGFDVTFLEVPSSGVVDPEAVKAAVRPSTLLVSVMAVNNEIGTVQPLREIVAAVKAANPQTLVHTDAVQALGKVPVDVREWGVDLAAFSAHKIGGLKGVGALFVRSHTPVEPLLHGGGHERGLRSGTLNVPGIVSFGAAAELAAGDLQESSAKALELRRKLADGIRSSIPDAKVNGDEERRVPGNLSVALPGANGETLLLLLDREGIACSTGSACQSGAADPSHVLLAIGLSKSDANATLRFTLGRTSTEDDVDAVLTALPEAVERARRIGA